MTPQPSPPPDSPRDCPRCGSRAIPIQGEAFCAACALFACQSGALGKLGPYLLETRLGEGGMGEVFLAFHEKTGRVVALKTPRRTGLDGEALFRRFAMEARALSLLDHPGILPIYDVGEENGAPYFAMKLAEGGSLAERRDTQPLPVRSIVELMAEVASAVHYAHDRGIVHRDLKPHNILLDENGHAMLADFGLARWSERAPGLTITGPILGTPDYAAPEVVEGSAPAAASDIFSLGAILYDLLAGEPPFRGATIAETIAKITRGDAVPLARRGDGSISKELDLICRRCLEHDPRDRYSSAAALAADLRAWLEGRAVSVRPLPAVEKLRRIVRRNPLVTALSLVTALAVTAVLAMALAANRSVLRVEKLRAQASANLAAERLGQERRSRVELLLRSGLSGQRRRALEILRQEWARQPDVELRSLAIRALALADFSDPGDLPDRGDRAVPPVPTELIAPNSGRRALVQGQDQRQVKIESASGAIEAQCLLPSPVTALAWNPAGDRLALGCWDKATYLWRAGAPAAERHVTTRDSETIRIAWHPEGRFAACLTKGGASLCLWDTDSAQDVVSASLFIPFDSPLDWTPEGNAVVFADSAGTRHQIKIQLPPGFRLFRLAVAEPQRENFCTLDLDAAQSRAVAVTDSGARLWDWKSGLSRIAVPKADNEWLGARFLSGDLQVCGWNSGLRSVSLTTPNAPEPSSDRQNPHVGCVLMDAPANGRWLGLLENPRDRFLVVRPGERKPAAILSQPSPFWITFNADGSRAATSSYAERDVHLWQLPEGRLERTLPVENSAALAFSPDGHTIATVLNRRTTLWDADAGRPLRNLDTPEPPRMAAWSPDGAWIAIQTRAAAYLFRAADGRLLARLQDPTPRPGDIHAAIAFSKSSHLLAEQFDDGSLLLWDLDQIRQGLSGLGMDWD